MSNTDNRVVIRDLGISFRDRPLQSIDAVRVIDDQNVLVKLTVHLFVETSTLWIVKGCESRLLSYSRDDAGKWWLVETIAVPVLDFEPYTIRNSGSAPSLAEWHEKRIFESECYRPGTSKQPMDGPNARWDWTS